MKSLRVLAVAGLVSLSVTPVWALFETDKELAQKANVSMIEAIKTAEAAMPGKPVEVEMGKDDGQVIYKIEIVDANSKTHKVYVNAMDGKIHEVKK